MPEGCRGGHRDALLFAITKDGRALVTEGECKAAEGISAFGVLIPG